MTKVTLETLQKVGEGETDNSMRMVQRWHGTAVYSDHVQRRLEKLSRPQMRVSVLLKWS